MGLLTKRAFSLLVALFALSALTPAFAQPLGDLGSKLLVGSGVPSGPDVPNVADTTSPPILSMTPSPPILSMTPSPGQWVVDNLGVGEVQLVFDEAVAMDVQSNRWASVGLRAGLALQRNIPKWRKVSRFLIDSAAGLRIDRWMQRNPHEPETAS